MTSFKTEFYFEIRLAKNHFTVTGILMVEFKIIVKELEDVKFTWFGG